MARSLRHLDIGSSVVIFITCALFVAALFVKGFGHGILLEAAVFLVSVKLIIMAYKSSVATSELNGRLTEIQAAQTRIEGLLEGRRPPGRLRRVDDRPA